MTDTEKQTQLEWLDRCITDYEERINNHREMQAFLRQARAKLLCPFEVGDKVISKSGHKATVTQVEAHDEGDGYSVLGRYEDLEDKGDCFLLGIQGWRLLEARP